MSTTPPPSPQLKAETLKCAVDAIELECRFAFGDIPSDHEFAKWLEPIASNQARLRAIFEKRNPWVLRFAEKFPEFWNDLTALNQKKIALKK